MDGEEAPLIGIFRPERLSRRGELVAWISTLITLTGWIILIVMNFPVFIGLKVLCVLLGLASMAISLGNWMDRRTQLEILASGIHFENGLRSVSFLWNEIERVEVFASSWGKKVSVIGQEAHFDFRTLGEFKVQADVKGRLGFEKGEEILNHILNAAQLQQVNSLEEGYYYFSRG